MKTYILQKDTPDLKAGREFIWSGAFDGYILVWDNTMDIVKSQYRFPSYIVEKDDGTWFKLKEEEKIKYE